MIYTEEDIRTGLHERAEEECSAVDDHGKQCERPENHQGNHLTVGEFW
jgi:hypothetical protein